MEAMLTTKDNPWNPFTHFKEWFQFDTSHGYNSSALLARVVVTSESLPPLEQIADHNEAIQDIVDNDPFNLFIPIFEGSDPKPLS